MSGPFLGPDTAAVARARSFWARMGDPPHPGWEVFLGPSERATSGQLILTDGQGCPLQQSKLLARALRRNVTWIDVALADKSGQVYSTGRIGRRRSLARTIDAARRVAAPLAVIASQRQPTGAAPTAPASSTELAFADLAGCGWFARRLTRAAVTYRQWACASIATPDPSSESLELTSAWHGGPSQFWADPFVLTHEGRTWLFMEQLSRVTGRGDIVMAEVLEGQLRDPRTVLANEHHLSFPQITRHQDRWLATVETCADHNPVYEFAELGDPWRPSADFPALPPQTADAVLDFESGVLVGTDAKTDGDSVLVTYRLDGRTWIPNPAATRVDAVWSRGGGTLDRGRSIRAVQNCTGTYGVQVGWTDSSDPDRHLAMWGPSALIGSSVRQSGIHTMSWNEPQTAVWIDGWRRRFSLLGWRYRRTELSHVNQCQG